MRRGESARTSRRRRPPEGGTSRTSATHPCGPSHPRPLWGRRTRAVIYGLSSALRVRTERPRTARRFDSEQVDREFSRRDEEDQDEDQREDRKSTRLNSSHANISYAVFCLKKKKKKH